MKIKQQKFYDNRWLIQTIWSTCWLNKENRLLSAHRFDRFLDSVVCCFFQFLSFCVSCSSISNQFPRGSIFFVCVAELCAGSLSIRIPHVTTCINYSSIFRMIQKKVDNRTDKNNRKKQSNKIVTKTMREAADISNGMDFYSKNIIHIKYTIANKNDIFSSTSARRTFLFIVYFSSFFLSAALLLCYWILVFFFSFDTVLCNRFEFRESNKKILSDGHRTTEQETTTVKVKMHLKTHSTDINNRTGVRNNKTEEQNNTHSPSNDETKENNR